MRKLRLSVPLLCIAIGACPADERPSEFVRNEEEMVTGRIVASSGGVLHAATGDELVVPSGALDADTDISLTPLLFSPDPALDLLGAVELKPDGLVFRTPATLTLALATPVAPDTELRLAEAFGPSITEFGDSGALFRVDASGQTATGLIYGFSSKACIKNCHAGTRNHLIEAWKDVLGRDSGCLAGRAGVSASAIASCDIAADPLQAMMAGFFEVCGEFPPGVPLSSEVREQVGATLDAGREVVFLFGTRIEAGSTGALKGVLHSAYAAVDSRGEIVLRNQVFVTNPDMLTRLEEAGVSTIVDYPLEEIDTPITGFRALRSGETYASLTGATVDLEGRPAVWPHVAVFCELPRVEAACNFAVATLQVEDRVLEVAFAPSEILSSRRIFTGELGFTAQSEDAVLQIEISPARVSGPGTDYSFSTFQDVFAGKADAYANFEHAEFRSFAGGRIPFACEAPGHLEITRWGDRLAGIYECNVSGTPESGGEAVTGVLSGRFDVELPDE